jgi:protein TonB
MTIFATLRAAIAAERYDATVVLGAIAESAQALTGATSAALAMRQDGLVICRARSGDISPQVGSRLSVDSGISGECLRTGKVLRCDDTEKDLRADPEVCRRLGLRSIAVVPLRGRRGTMGVLEAFSTRPFAFAEEHMKYLIRLAELAENARLRESGVIESAEDLRPSLPQPKKRASVVALTAGILASAKDAVVPQVRVWLNSRKMRLTLAALTVGLLFVLGFTSWNSRRGSTSSETAKESPDSTESAATTMPAPAAASTDLVWKPSPVHVAPAQPGDKSGIQIAAKREVERLKPPPPPTNSQTSENTDVPLPSAPSGDPSAPGEAPVMGALAPGKSAPALTSAPVAMPAFGLPVSQGLSGGVLEHKVQPVYPLQALPMRLSGNVILQATIGEKGKVDDVKVVSGPPLLTAAAIDAVRQWRYTPFLLDGKPVKMQKQITISFQAP